MQQRQTTTIVGQPMTPELLARIGGLGEFPRSPTDFQPDGAWVNRYRIHTCHGYFESGNRDQGVLRVERIPEDGRFTLKVRQRIVADAGSTHILDAWIRCEPDALASLIQWRVLSRYEDISGEPMPELDGEVSGSVAGSRMDMVTGGQTKSRELARPLTSDWTLFEAIQRLAPSPPDVPVFDVLEGLSLYRDEHRIGDRGNYRADDVPGAPLRWYQQIGRGVLPYEYWLGSDRRLLVVTTHARAYVLDDNADEAVNQRLQRIREQQARRRRG